MVASAALACCLPAGIDSKAMLSENWLSKAAEAAEAAAAAAAAGAAAPPAFVPSDPQYNELARRLSKSAAMCKVQELHAAVAQHEKQLPGLTGEAKEAKKAELEECQQQLAEAQAALTELQASFEQDPLSLVPWMNALFALADSGCSTFDTGGAVDIAHPPSQVPLAELLAPPVAAAGGPAGASAWLYRGAERVLGTFKRRYELERGGASVRVTTRLALSPFGGAPAPELAAAAEAAVEASRQAVLGPEAAAAGGLLDTLLLHWLGDCEEDPGAFVAVLLALKRLLAPPGYNPDDPAAAAAQTLEVAPKLAALGLVNPTAAALTAAIRAGVPISCVSLPFSLLDTSAAPLLALCAEQGIHTVYAAAPTAHGLVSDAFLGAAAPSGTGALSGCDNLAAGLDVVARYGGWPRFQALLTALQAIGAQHGGTSPQVVALAWLQQQGLVPLLPAHWGPAASTTTATAADVANSEGSAASAQAAASLVSTQPVSGWCASAPWPLTLGLQHYKLDPPPPLPSAAEEEEARAQQAGAAAETDTAATEAANGDAGAAEAPAAAAEETKESEMTPAEVAVEEPVQAEPAPAAAARGSGKGQGCWVDSLSQLLSTQDLAALAALAGRGVSAA